MGVLSVVLGDVTRQEVDAVVNAANEVLAPGGGVCGAIHRAGGPAIAAECDEIGGCPTGSAVVTGGGALAARWVVHAVGPVWRGGGAGEEELLGSAYRAALGMAARAGARTVAFPALSCGIYGYPLEQGARVAVSALREALEEFPSVAEARIVLFDDATLVVFERALEG